MALVKVRTFQGTIGSAFNSWEGSQGTRFIVNSTIVVSALACFTPGGITIPTANYVNVPGVQIALTCNIATFAWNVFPGAFGGSLGLADGTVLASLNFTVDSPGTLDATNQLLIKELSEPLTLEPGEYVVWCTGYDRVSFPGIDSVVGAIGSLPVESTSSGSIEWATYHDSYRETFSSARLGGNLYPAYGPYYPSSGNYSFATSSFIIDTDASSGGGGGEGGSSTVTLPLWTHDAPVTCGWVADPDETCGWVSDATLPCTVTEVTEITYWDFSMTSLVDFSQTTEAATFDSTMTGADN